MNEVYKYVFFAKVNIREFKAGSKQILESNPVPYKIIRNLIAYISYFLFDRDGRKNFKN